MNRPSEKAYAKVRRWRQNFLDLSTRNHQLYWSPASSIELLHPDMRTLFRILIVLGTTCEFPKVFRGKKKSSRKTKNKSIKNNDEEIETSKENNYNLKANNTSKTENEIDEAYSKILDNLKLGIKHKEALQKKLSKARLTEIITPLTDTQLTSKVKKYLQDAASAREERGVHILFITLGILNWIEDGKKIKSPLLFVPVKLRKKPIEIEILNDEVFLSPALREKMKGMRINFPIFPLEYDSRSLGRWFDEIKEAIRFERDWEIEERVFLGTFSFTKAALYEDLSDEEAILSHPIIRAIAEETGYIEPPEHLPPLHFQIDDQDPKLSYTILDSDSSQAEAIEYAKRGCSLIIQGPPGTGKSQCIVNIIAEILGQGKTVLFVAQKQAALDVVRARLDKCGLGEFALQVHSQSANKSEILQQLDASMNRPIEIHPSNDLPYEELKSIRDKLNEYVELINRPYGKLGFSIYYIIGKLLSLKKVPYFKSTQTKDPNELSEADFIQIQTLFDELEQYRDTLERFDENPWSYAKITNPLLISSSLKSELRKILENMKDSITMLLENESKFENLIETSTYLKIDENNKGENNKEENYKEEDNKEENKKKNRSYRRASSFKTEWELQLDKLKYWDMMLNIFPAWYQLHKSYHELAQYFRVYELIDFTPIITHFNSFDQIRLAYIDIEDKISDKEKNSILNNLKLKKEIESLEFWFKGDKKIYFHKLKKELLSYIEDLNLFVNRLTVFNLKSGLKPIKNRNDLYQFKQFFEKFKPIALSLDTDVLIYRFTIEYDGMMKRRSESYQNDKTTIFNCVIKPDQKANQNKLLGYLSLIKSFQDRYGKFLGWNEEELNKIYYEFLKIDKDWSQILHSERFLLPLTGINILKGDIPKENLLELNKFSEQWIKNLPDLNTWFEIEVRYQHLQDLGYGAIIEKLKNNMVSREFKLKDIFLKHFYQKWLTDLIESLPPIENFQTTFHDSLIKRFKDIDKEILFLNQIRLRNFLYKRRPTFDPDEQYNSELINKLLTQRGLLQREIKKKRNIRPLRALFSDAKEYLTLLKPLWMMSPLAIANFLAIPAYSQYFDVVIFDEASQVTPEDAIGAIVRGKSLVVVGDSKQMPPTDFFRAKSADDLDNLDVSVQSMESLLDECTGIGFREKLLKFHYRSRKEGLIAFSNAKYYQNRLFTFPDLDARSYINYNIKEENQQKNQPDYLQIEQDNLKIEQQNNQLSGDLVDLPAIEFVYVSNGKKIKGRNEIEAKVVAEAIIEHYKSNLESNRQLSLGIVAFSQAQQETIRNSLEKLTPKYPELENIIFGGQEPLFIKNLENAQGDERDFIFFSIGYAKDSKGKMGLNFGPLNRKGGYRRLNVAITRARHHIKLFSSFLPSDIDLSRVNADGVRDLVEYMRYAKTGKLPNTIINSISTTLFTKDEFLYSVKQALESKGYLVVVGVGVSAFKIDLGIINKQNNKFKIGIILDGGSYKIANSARDRDRIREAVLKGLGWNLYHIWSMDWFNNKDRIILEIEQFYNNQT